MRKLKNILAFLLTFVLLAAGGLLPMGAAYVQDQNTANVVQYADIEALQLTLEEDALSMTFPEKLWLLINGMGVETTVKDMKLKEDTVMEAAYTALAPYMDLFFGGSFDNDYIEYYPVIVYDESDPTRCCYYWHVIMSLDMSMDDNLSVVLDDETGKILSLELIDSELHIDEAYLEKLQYNLAASYFADLGMEPVAEWPVEAIAADNSGISLAATNYIFIDEIHGAEINVQIGVRSDGFYIYIL